jgi:hypothetical protein
MELPPEILDIIRAFSKQRFTQYNALRILRPSRPPICVSDLIQYHRSLILFNLGDEFDILHKEPALHRAKEKLLSLRDEIDGLPFYPMDLKNEEPFQVS